MIKIILKFKSYKIYIVRGEVALDSKETHDQRRELIEIFNALSLSEKKLLLAAARIIDVTRELVLCEGNKMRVKEDLSSKLKDCM